MALRPRANRPDHVNEIFHFDQFWRLYFALESSDLSEEDVTLQLDALAKDFMVRSETVRFEHQGRPCSVRRRVAEFDFVLDGAASLLLEYAPATDGGFINLFLVDSDGTQQMGWWDLARWHPYCLRSEELDLLLEHWRAKSSVWSDSSVPLLLLAPFVGLCDVGEHDVLTHRVLAAHSKLCPTAETPLPDPPVSLQADYRWEREPELGWVFTSGDYACYSIRNRGHANCGEEAFPFVAWARHLDAMRETPG